MLKAIFYFFPNILQNISIKLLNDEIKILNEKIEKSDSLKKGFDSKFSSLEKEQFHMFSLDKQRKVQI